ncbi:MAG: DUF4145 domain-containing protein [Hymenobacter sp.]|nr:MAG: DUF4145 domain-containing protein [Hymenobacter sp.]
MTLKQFADAVQLSKGTEVEKAILIAFYQFKIKSIEQLSIATICKLLHDLGVANPNATRLRNNIISSRNFIQTKDREFKLKLSKVEALEVEFPNISVRSEEVIADETVLPQALFFGGRGYIVSVCNQINACYQYNVFDGCAMLMRRLLEMLIILTYRHLGREDEIKNAHGGYHKLSAMITHYTQNKVFVIAKKSQDVIDEFRELGNHSAHTVEYHARRVDIDRVRMDYRVCIEELMYKCGLIK